NSTGMAKFAYGADLGGNVYRISGTSPNVEIGNTDPEKWTITKIAAFGGSGADNRKFMFGPDVLDENGTYVLLIGSGDREKPLRQYASASAVQNRFYVFRDKPTVATYLSDEKTNCGAELICHASLTPILDKTTPSDSVLAAKKGWYLALSASEQVVTSAITVFNTVIFSTHVPTPPDPNQCSALGTAYTYNLNYTNAASTRTDSSDRGRPVAGGGLLPSAVVGNVNVDGRTVTVCTSCGAGGGGAGGGDDGDRLKFKVLEAPTGAIRPKSRVYWKIKK
ncbi:MAG TPA: pilus assembly protein PilY, partial [Methylophilus sp.]